MNVKPSARTVWVASFLLALSLAAIFIWPTRYRYDHVLTPGYSGPIRTDRLTGRVQQFQPGVGWVTAHPAQTAGPSLAPQQNLPKSALDKVVLQECRSKEGSGTLVCELYDGSTWNIKEVIVEVTVQKDAGPVAEMRRQYAMRAVFPIKPFTDGICEVWAAPYLWPSQRWHSHLIAAKGTGP